jgi:hypothetical protein
MESGSAKTSAPSVRANSPSFQRPAPSERITEQTNNRLKETPHLEALQMETRRVATEAETRLLMAERTGQTGKQLERENLVEQVERQQPAASR